MYTIPRPNRAVKIILALAGILAALLLLVLTAPEARAEVQAVNHSEATAGRPRMVKPVCDFRVLYAKELTHAIVQVPRIESGHAWPVEFYAWVVLAVPVDRGMCNLPQVVGHSEGGYHYPMVWYDGTSGEIWLRIDLHCPVAAGQFPLKITGWAWDETAYRLDTALWELTIPMEVLKAYTVPARYCTAVD